MCATGFLLYNWRTIVGSIVGVASSTKPKRPSSETPATTSWWPKLNWSLASVLPGYRTYPYIVYLEGPPGAGKTFSESTIDWRRLFGRQCRFVRESIPDGVLADYNNPAKKAIVGYTFEHFMVAVREKVDADCRGNLSVTHILDRTLIGSFVFHVANYVIGDLADTQAQELFSMSLPRVACSPVLSIHTKSAMDTCPEIVIVYYASQFALCHRRVVERNGPDACIPSDYHQLVTVVYAYVISMLAERMPSHIGFIVDTDFGSLTPGRVNYEEQRRRTIEMAAENLDIVLTVEQKVRFDQCMLYVSANAPTVAGFKWEQPINGKTRGRSSVLVIRDVVKNLQSKHADVMTASGKNAQRLAADAVLHMNETKKEK